MFNTPITGFEPLCALVFNAEINNKAVPNLQIVVFIFLLV
jgi:hypothetical protein